MEQIGASLTKREHEILAYLVRRLSNQEIADRLYLSVATVKWYNTQIFAKLGVKNRAEAVRLFQNPLRNVPASKPKRVLPIQATPFIGRASELQDLTHLLSDVNVRIITILAPGGMGKTRLAIEIAARHAEIFAFSVCIVSLAQIAMPADLVTAIGGALGLTFHGTGEPKEQLLDFLHNQELLLVLDNFEHLVAEASLVAEIVTAAPKIKALITSREKLNLSGETIYVLGGMGMPTGAADSFTCDSVQLFLYHARRVRRDFNEDDTASILRIAQLTQGMPLGLMLAAAWADVLSPMQIADEISRSADVLHHDLRDVPIRHRSILAVFDPTWERLTPAQRKIFMWLSVFRGGFSREAASSVFGVDVRVLSELAGKSLIQPQPNQRYTVHELLRQYGESHLNASRTAGATHAAHSAFFLDFLVQRQEDVIGRRQLAALGEINEDYENIRSAWLWALAHAQVDSIQQALECLVISGELTGKLLETRALLQQSVESLGASAPILGDRILVRLARIDSVLRNDVTSEVVEAILTRGRARGDPLEIIWCLWVQGGQEATIYGRDRQARHYYEEMITLSRTTGNDYFLAHGLTGVSWRYANDDEIDRAVATLREAIAIRHRSGDVKNLDFVTGQLAWLSFDLLREAESAEALLDEQIAMQSQTGTTSILPLMFGIKAWMAFWRYEINATVKLAHMGLTIAHNHNYLGGQSTLQGALGLVKIYAGEYQQAQRLCQDVAKSGFFSLTGFVAHWVLAFSSYGLGDEARCGRSLKVALQIACRFKSPTFQGMSLLLVAIAIVRKSDPLRAVEYVAFCFAQPPHLAKWLHQWPLLAEVRAQLQAQLGVEAYAAAWARGQSLDLNTEAAKSLAALQL